MSKKKSLKVDVLVVEDDADMRMTMAELLDDVGYAVAIAANGAEALELIDSHVVPSMILLDLHMPVMSGWQFLDARKARRGLDRVPVVTVSGAGEEPIVGRRLAGTLEKPALMRDLLGLVARVIGPAHHLAPPPAPLNSAPVVAASA